jgi:ring-1,2-phenylacetyl-CoA epoxidase subunit PaaC
MRREETYHLLHVEAWLRRLAEAKADGRQRLAAAVRALWNDAQAVFAPLGGEELLTRSGILPEPMTALHAKWLAMVRPVLEPIAGDLPDADAALDGRTVRTDEFRWLHGEFTMVAGSEEGALW